MGNLVHPVRRRLPPPGARRGAPRPGGAVGILRRAADQPRLRAYRDGARAGGAARPAVAGAALPVLRRGKTAAGRNRRAALYRGGLLRPDRSHGLRHLPHRRRRSSSAARLDRHAHRRLRGIHSRRRRPALPWRPARRAEPGGRLPGARIPARPGHDRQALPLLAGTAAPALSYRRQGPLAGRRQPAVPRSAGRSGEDPRPPRRTRRRRSRAAAPAGDPWRGGAGACRPTLR